MVRSRQETATLQCPTCSASFEAPVWQIIDADERPDLRAALLEERLQQALCSHCGAAGTVSAPLLYHDARQQQLVLALPLSVRTPQAAQQLAEELQQTLLESLALHPGSVPAYLQQVALVPELDGLRHLLAPITADPHTTRLYAALDALITAATGEEFRQVLVEHRALLMQPDADTALEAIIAQARSADDRGRARKAVEQRALLSRFRTTLLSRRAALADLLDGLAPLSNAELAVLPALRSMLEAVDPQEVYAARLTLEREAQTLVDGLIERLVAAAQRDEREDLSDFLTELRSLRER